MIDKGKLQMQIGCGFEVCPAVCPKLFKVWFCLNKEKGKAELNRKRVNFSREILSCKNT